MNIQQVISKHRILMETSIDSKDSALLKLADSFYKDDIITSIEIFLKDVDGRENEYCTYIGHETAIPHAISNSVKEASIAFLKVKEGVKYGSDEENAKLIFMLAIPKDANADHLKMLSMLATQLMHQEFRDELIAAEDVSSIYDVLMKI